MTPTTKAAVIEALPPLPPHKHSRNSGAFDPLYTADQMREYALSALRSEPEPTPEPGERERFEAWWFDEAVVEALENARSVEAECWLAWQARASLPPAPEPVAGWQPIETAPKDGTPFLAWRRGQIAIAYLTPRDDCEMWTFGTTSAAVETFPEHKPSYWQALPPAPTKGATQPTQPPDTDGTAPRPPRA